MRFFTPWKMQLIFSALIVFSTASCSVNILDPFAKKDTDQALLDEAKIEINKGSYSDAIDLFDEM
ncbi:MAG: hypothetical protein AAF202_02925, partial [Pseudomonadota bacterium]